MQEKFILTGLVHPERAKFAIQGEKNIYLNRPDEEKYFIDIKAQEGKISLHVTIDNRTGNEWDIKNIVTTLVQSQLDALGFEVNKFNGTHVFALDLEIQSITNLDTKEHTSLGNKEHLFHEGDAPDLPEKFSSLAAENKPLARALSNFRQAILYPDETAFYCFRAVEALAGAFRANQNPEEQMSDPAWQKFRETLHLSRPAIDKYKAIQEIIRHGRMIPQKWHERHEQLQISWQIIYRYAHFLDRGSRALCRDEFPFFAESETAAK